MGHQRRASRRGPLLVLVVVGLALAVRLLYLLEHLNDPSVHHPGLDALFHDMWAQAILEGDVLGSEVFFRAPLYPYLLALIYALFGRHPLPPLIFQGVLGVVAVFAVYLLTRRLTGRTAALVAGILMALYAPLVFYEGELLFDAPLAALTAVWLAFVPTVLERRTWWMFAGLGLCAGILALMRPLFLVVAPVFVVLLFAGRVLRWEDVVHAGLVMLGILVVIMPVAIRNVIVGGEFVPVAAQGGINFYIGNNPVADGASSSVPGAGGVFWSPRRTREVAAKAIGHMPRPGEESRYWYGRGITFFLEEPGDAARLLLQKAYLLMNHQEISNNRSLRLSREESRVLGMLPAGFWLLGPMGLTGLWFLRQDPQARWILWFVVVYGLVMVAFFVCGRFRLPLVPPLCVAAGVMVDRGVVWWKGREWMRLVRGAVVAGVAAVVVNSSLVTVTAAEAEREYFQRGCMALAAGDDRAAVQWFTRSAASGVVLPHVDVNLGVLAYRTGDRSGARSYFLAELRRNPESFAAEANLAYLDLEGSPSKQAMEHAARAAFLRPDREEGYVVAASVLLARNELAGAESTLRSPPPGRGLPSPRMEMMLLDLRIRGGEGLESADSTLCALIDRVQEVRQPAYEPEDWPDVGGGGDGGKPELLAELLCKRGHIGVQRGRMESAAQLFRAAAEVDPGNLEAWANGGLSMVHAGRAEEGAAFLRLGLDEHAAEAELWYNYGVALVNAGRSGECVVALERAISLDPTLDGARTLLSEVRKGHVR